MKDFQIMTKTYEVYGEGHASKSTGRLENVFSRLVKVLSTNTKTFTTSTQLSLDTEKSLLNDHFLLR